MGHFFRHVAAAFLLTALGASSAYSAETFPTRAMTYMVTFNPGGQSDREARRQEPLLKELLGQSVLVDYKVGGGGAMGWKELVGSKPDGYTFAGFNIPHVILQPLLQEVGYKTEQLVPVCIFQRTFLGLAVPLDSPYQTLEDFIAAAKAAPGKLKLCGSGSLSGHHIAVLSLQKQGGLRLTYIPETGSATQMTGFLGGHYDAIMANSDDLCRFKDKARILAVTSAERMTLFPDVPTFKEKGFDMVLSIDRGVAVPPGTPTPVIATLEKAFMDIARRPEIISAQEKEGFSPVAMGHEDSVAYIEEMTKFYGDILKDVRKK
ncbi:MAG TPA: tripartite tricarboxylate transporter substrate binding protein [Candidatus Mailhella excrementigallinarum]|nr:tripartite tricarboxylate transporter substrate binding protein [Candidatus Mailhella excrementigallinarum]